MTKVGFVALDEYGGPDHRECECERHAGQGIPAVAVIAVAGSEVIPDSAWGACAECFGMMNDSLDGGRANWHLAPMGIGPG